MKYKIFIDYRTWLVLVALAIIAVIATRPMFLLGNIGYVWVAVLLVISAGLLIAVSLWLACNAKKWYTILIAIFLFCIFFTGLISSGYILYRSAPDMSSYEVKTMFNYRFSDSYNPPQKVSSVEYIGDRIWKVRLISALGISYLYYNEKTGDIGNTAEDVGWLEEMPAIKLKDGENI